MILNRRGCLFVRFRERDLPIEIEFHNKMKLDIRINRNARIRVKVPVGKDIDVIEKSIKEKISWILKQLVFYEEHRDVFEAFDIKAGSSVRFLGRLYLVEIAEGETKVVELHGKFLRISIPSRDSSHLASKILQSWLREQAQEIFASIYDRCFEKISKYGVEWTPFHLKKMKGRWGSCTANGTIYLNPGLVIFAPHLIEYAVLHELCHLISSRHDAVFYKHLDLLMPDWREREANLKTG